MPFTEYNINPSGVAAFIAAPLLLHCWKHYCWRANLATNTFHIVHKLLEKLSGPMHTIKYTDTSRLKQSRFMYTLLHILERRYPVTKHIFQVPSQFGHNIPVAVYQPSKCTDRHCPAVIYYHGGGFTLGGISMYEHITTAMADKIGAIVFFIDYRLGE